MSKSDVRTSLVFWQLSMIEVFIAAVLGLNDLIMTAAIYYINAKIPSKPNQNAH